MKKNKLIFTLIFTTILILSGCGKQVADEVDFGTIEDSIYHNQYFGLSVRFPPNWNPLSQETLKQISKKGAETLAGNGKDMDTAIKASEMTTVHLFGVFMHPVNVAVPSNQNLMSVAEYVKNTPITKAEDYLLNMQKAMEMSQIKVSFPKKISMELIGNKEFSVTHVEMLVGEITVKQTYYVAIIKGYALAFIMTFMTDEEKLQLKNILESITFK